ncbi:MAG: clan AA aspartic protease [Flavobacteriales bacterium]|nr:clan AA aspartic protease [Flavobacteriales bacterium]
MKIDTFFKKRGYHKVLLGKNEIGHYQLLVTINGVEGNFILDTGASSSCVGTKFAEKYLLEPESSDYKAAGAGAIDMDTFQAEVDSMKIEDVEVDIEKIILFDLTQINEALDQHDSELIDGIIGAEILEQLKAVISYEEKALFIKEMELVDSEV